MSILINLGCIQDEDRKIFIEYNNGKFTITHSDLSEQPKEHLTEYSFESFVATYTLMGSFLRELCVNDIEALNKLYSIKKNNFEQKYILIMSDNNQLRLCDCIRDCGLCFCSLNAQSIRKQSYESILETEHLIKSNKYV